MTETADSRGRADNPAPAVRGGVGPVLERFPSVARIAVLRGGGLGDLMFALPAVDALAAAYPDAEITLLGTPLHAALLAGRPGPVHRVEVLPFAPGVRPGPEDPDALAAFFASQQARNYDLAVQVHGGGRNSNPFLLQLGAAHTVGTGTPDAVSLERTMPGDRVLADQIVALSLAAAGPDIDVGSVAGMLDLGTLAALLQASAVMVGNDSGPRHLAQAVGTPTVGIYWFGNVINAGAMGRTRHRVHMSWVSACPVCGADVTQVGWTAQRCEHDDSFVAAVDPAAVSADVAELLTAPPA